MKKLLILNILSTIIFFSFTGFSQTELKKAESFLYYEDYDSALFYLQKALKKEPNNENIYLLKGKVLYRKKNFNGALNNFNLSNKLKPGIANFYLAKTYAKMGNVDKSCNLLEDLIKNRDVSVSEVKRDKDLKLVVHNKCFDEIISKVRISSYENLLNELWFDIKYKNYNEALNKIDEVLKKNNRKHYLFYLKGKILLLNKDTLGALKNFSEAYNLKKNEKKYICSYSEALLLKKKPKKALSVLKLKLKKFANDPFYMRLYAKALYYSGKYSQASVVLEDSVLKYLYKDTMSYFFLAKSYYKMGKYFPAMRNINKAIKLYPENDEFIFLRGKIYFETRAYRLALKEFRYIVDLKPFVGEYYYFLALTQLNFGDKFNACKNFKKAFSLKYMKADDFLRKECVK